MILLLRSKELQKIVLMSSKSMLLSVKDKEIIIWMKEELYKKRLK